MGLLGWVSWVWLSSELVWLSVVDVVLELEMGCRGGWVSLGFSALG